MSKHNKKPVVMYVNDAMRIEIDQFAKKSNLTRTAAAEILMKVGLRVKDLPIRSLST
jgi:hypothetical protein